MLLADREKKKWTATEVLQMLDAGILRDGEPLELIEGDLVVVSPQGAVHSSLAVRLRRMLEQAYGDAFHVRNHSPVMGLPDSMPEPDIAVVRGGPDDFMREIPGSRQVPLVIEISATTRTDDRKKARVYAAAQYGAYWIVDVDKRRLEVRTSPTDDQQYMTTQIFDENATVVLPGVGSAVLIKDLLP